MSKPTVLKTDKDPLIGAEEEQRVVGVDRLPTASLHSKSVTVMAYGIVRVYGMEGAFDSLVSYLSVFILMTT